MSNLSDYPDELYELDMRILDISKDIRNRMYDLRRKEAEIDYEASTLPADEFPNAAARNAYAAKQKNGEAYMEIQRDLDNLNDEKAQAEAERSRTRRQWKVAQIVEQKRMRELAFRTDDEHPEKRQPVDPWDDDDDFDDGPGQIEPDDDLPF